ncbi:Uncharacterised protein [Salmonella enterica]|nr:Uncharacterised protein [Salmonella enterica]
MKRAPVIPKHTMKTSTEDSVQSSVPSCTNGRLTDCTCWRNGPW